MSWESKQESMTPGNLPVPTHPFLKVLPRVDGLDEVFELDDAVGHKVIVSERGVVEDRQFDLLAVVHVHAELLVVGRLVGLLLGVSLSDFVFVHLHHHVGVQRQRGLVEDDGVARGGGGGLEVQSLTNAQLQVPVKLHLDKARARA